MNSLLRSCDKTQTRRQKARLKPPESKCSRRHFSLVVQFVQAVFLWGGTEAFGDSLDYYTFGFEPLLRVTHWLVKHAIADLRPTGVSLDARHMEKQILRAVIRLYEPKALIIFPLGYFTFHKYLATPC